MTVHNDSEAPIQSTITLYARVGASEVLNEIGQVVIPAFYTPITSDAEREERGYAPEAKNVVSLDLVSILRQAADDLERAAQEDALRWAGGHL